MINSLQRIRLTLTMRANTSRLLRGTNGPPKTRHTSTIFRHITQFSSTLNLRRHRQHLSLLRHRLKIINRRTHINHTTITIGMDLPTNSQYISRALRRLQPITSHRNTNLSRNQMNQRTIINRRIRSQFRTTLTTRMSQLNSQMTLLRHTQINGRNQRTRIMKPRLHITRTIHNTRPLPPHRLNILHSRRSQHILRPHRVLMTLTQVHSRHLQILLRRHHRSRNQSTILRIIRNIRRITNRRRISTANNRRQPIISLQTTLPSLSLRPIHNVNTISRHLMRTTIHNLHLPINHRSRPLRNKLNSRNRKRNNRNSRRNRRNSQRQVQ